MVGWITGVVFLAASMQTVGAQVQDSPDVCRSGRRLFAQGQTIEAIDALWSCVSREPRNAGAWATLGAAHASRGDYEGAEKPFRIACELSPSLPDACLYYARTLYLLNRFAAALEVLEKAPATNQTTRVRGLCLEALGRITDAEKAFLDAIRMSGAAPGDEDPAIDYGVFLFRQGRPGQALDPLETAIKRRPENARAHLELGAVLLALDRVSEAESQLQRAVALDPRSARAHLLLGKALMRLGRAEAARAHLDQGSRTVK